MDANSGALGRRSLRCKGLSVVVTGGSRGIGRSIVLKFAGEGAKVTAVYRSDHVAAAEMMEMAGDGPGDVQAVQACVTDRTAIKRIAEQVRTRYGRIDVLVNNAGIFKVGCVALTDPSQWDQVIDVNLKGTLNWTSAVAREMVAQGGGTIINMSSIAAFRGLAGQAAYAATKAGVSALTRCLALELGRHGIRVVAIAPGPVGTAMIKGVGTAGRGLCDLGVIAETAVVLATDDGVQMGGKTVAIEDSGRQGIWTSHRAR